MCSRVVKWLTLAPFSVFVVPFERREFAVFEDGESEVDVCAERGIEIFRKELSTFGSILGPTRRGVAGVES